MNISQIQFVTIPVWPNFISSNQQPHKNNFIRIFFFINCKNPLALNSRLPGGNLSRLQILFSSRSSISSLIAFRHFSASGLKLLVCFTDMCGLRACLPITHHSQKKLSFLSMTNFLSARISLEYSHARIAHARTSNICFPARFLLVLLYCTDALMIL